jgi:hypothetical protein
MRVGIHDNMVLANVALNDKGTLGLTFRPVSLNPELANEFSEDGIPVDYSNDEGSTLLLFCPNMPSYKKKDGSDLSDVEKAEQIRDDFGTFRLQLQQILGAYRSIKDLKFKPYEGTGINEANWKQELLEEDQRKKIYNNYAEQFMAMVAPFLNDDSKPIRLKLVRQSAAKHYATIPSKYIKDNPFVEPMEVPADRSLLKYTKWEKDKGYDNGDPISQDSADPIPEVNEESSSHAFGRR